MAKLTPATCRAARGLVDLTQQDLADKAGVGLSTVKAFEAGRTAPMTQNLDALLRALQAVGVEFISENGGGPGVRLRDAGGR